MSRGIRDVPRRALLQTFVRAFTIQGSWNYRNMLGNGFAFSLLPVLRELYGDGELDSAVKRHSEHFNAHPYMANVALGASARMEAEGAGEEVVRRFKDAVGGPLGGVGDTLVWATLLPSTLLLALVLAWLGVGPIASVAAFLVLYNGVHLFLRVWGFRVGLREGRMVAGTLRHAALGARAESLTRVGTFLAGVFLGVVVAGDAGLGDPRWVWAGLALLAVGLGMVGGHRVWRPTASAVVGAIVVMVFVQLFFG